MDHSPVKKKYTIWQTLREQGFFRVFNCPDYPGLWGTEKKLTYKHKQSNQFFVHIKEGSRHLGSAQFDNMPEAMTYYLKHFGTK